MATKEEIKEKATRDREMRVLIATIPGYVELSAYTTEDSDGNSMLKSHAYKAATAGMALAYSTSLDAGEYIAIYVGTTTDPAGAGDLIQQFDSEDADSSHSVCALVAEDEYFEVLCTADPAAPTIRWKSFGTLSKPIDQD